MALKASYTFREIEKLVEMGSLNLKGFPYGLPDIPPGRGIVVHVYEENPNASRAVKVTNAVTEITADELRSRIYAHSDWKIIVPALGGVLAPGMDVVVADKYGRGSQMKFKIKNNSFSNGRLRAENAINEKLARV